MNDRIPMSRMKRGDRCVYSTCDGLSEREASYLTSIGFIEGCEIKACRVGSTCIMDIGPSDRPHRRIGMTRSLAKRLLVLPCA